MAQPPMTASTPTVAVIVAILLLFMEHILCGAFTGKQHTNLASRPYLLKQKHFHTQMAAL
jgi:carbonic anhydrase